MLYGLLRQYVRKKYTCRTKCLKMCDKTTLKYEMISSLHERYNSDGFHGYIEKNRHLVNILPLDRSVVTIHCHNHQSQSQSQSRHYHRHRKKRRINISIRMDLPRSNQSKDFFVAKISVSHADSMANVFYAISTNNKPTMLPHRLYLPTIPPCLHHLSHYYYHYSSHSCSQNTTNILSLYHEKTLLICTIGTDHGPSYQQR